MLFFFYSIASLPWCVLCQCATGFNWCFILVRLQVTVLVSIAVSLLRACRCGRFLLSLDTDEHPSCSRCRELKCAQLNLCDSCVLWDESWWQRVAAYKKKLEKKRARKRELRALNRASESFSGFCDMSSVSLVSDASPLVDKSAAPSGEPAAGLSALSESLVLMRRHGLYWTFGSLIASQVQCELRHSRFMLLVQQVYLFS